MHTLPKAVSFLGREKNPVFDSAKVEELLSDFLSMIEAKISLRWEGLQIPTVKLEAFQRVCARACVRACVRV